MRSKEQFNLQIQWLDKELERYNNYKKEAVIERFNQLRSVLKEELKDVDLVFVYSFIHDKICYFSLKLGINNSFYFTIFKDPSKYKNNSYLEELINLVEEYSYYYTYLAEHCSFKSNGYKIL